MVVVGRRARLWMCLLATMVLQPLTAGAQEVLLPLQTGSVARMAAKSADTALTLPFFDDFAATEGSPSPARWCPGGAMASDGARLRPTTVGVVTLDAIDAKGQLYDDASTSIFPADTLLSRRIRLDSLTPADSVVLSFYYLPGGGKGNLWERVGDAPEEIDSLFLDFYRAVDSSWVTVWSRGGTTVDSLISATGMEWQYVTVALTEMGFFDSMFCFRFRNHCSLPITEKPGMAGNCDYWHLDYILLDSARRSTGAPEFRDVAFVDPAPSMLKIYRAMPARQYRAADMADSLEMTITNLFSSEVASQYLYSIVDELGDTVYQYNGGYENAPPFLPGGNYQTASAHATPSVNYSFPEDTTTRTYTIVHMVREGVSGDTHRESDTVRFSQVFGNYYAYDDGTAENGYGLTSTASHVYLAYRFDLNVEDTLTAVELYFNRCYDGENEMVPFKLAVWSNRDGHPGELLYSDHTSRFPQFNGLNKFCRYVLEHPVVVNGSIFVGFDQGNNYFINLGFDRQSNTSDRIWYMTGTEWQQSILSGSLMLRPGFGASAMVGIAEPREEHVTWVVYPNPASEWVNIEGVPEMTPVMVYDMTGRQVAITRDNRLRVADLPEGVYVLRCLLGNGAMDVKKLIIKH